MGSNTAWSLFDDGEGELTNLTPIDDASSPSLLQAGESPSAPHDDDADDAPATTPPPAATPYGPQARVPIPLELSLPVLVRFLAEHGDTTATELSELLDPIASAGPSAGVVTSAGSNASADSLARQCEEPFARLRASVQSLSLMLTPAARPGRGKKAHAQAAPLLTPPVAAVSTRDGLISDLRGAANQLHSLTWGWMAARRSWPHVVFRELYCLSQLSRAVAFGHEGAPLQGMECIDMALILGVAGREVEELIGVFDRACLMVRAATEALAQLQPPIPPSAAKDGSPESGPSPSFAQVPVPLINNIPTVLSSEYAAAMELPQEVLQGAGLLAAMAGPFHLPRPISTPVPRVAALPAPGPSAPKAPAGKRGAQQMQQQQQQQSQSDAAAAEHPALSALRAFGPGKPLSATQFRAQWVGRHPPTPVVLCGAMSNWPGLTAWRDLSALRARHGHRTVPIEIGHHLSGPPGSWREESMLFSRFIDEYLAPSVAETWPVHPTPPADNETAATESAVAGSSASVDAPAAAAAPVASEIVTDEQGARHLSAAPAAAADPTADPTAAAKSRGGTRPPAYLAQHGLFEQIPTLIDDLRIPIHAGDEIGAVNAWIGTAGTKTRLHFDEYDNLLAQAVGYKLVRMYDPAQTHLLYRIPAAASGPTAATAAAGADSAHGDSTTAQGNISAVDVEHPDFAAHPLFAQAVAQDAVLGPGDMLFIPKGVWHYVRSLSPSFSVNFWF